MVIGGNGAGKSTFSKVLSAKLDLPLIHLDQLYWKDNWQPICNDEFDKLHCEAVTNPKWVMDGSFRRTMPIRLKYCDTAIYLDFSRLTYVYGVIKRVLTNYDKTRADMGGNCPEKFDWNFMKDVWAFNKNNRKYFYDLLNNSKDVKIIILKNRRQASKFLSKL